MSQRPETMAENDIIVLLRQQHDEIRRLFAETETSEGKARRDAFDRLRRYLAVHETAEEQILHPQARRSLDDGDEVVAARLAEEHEAKRMLAALERLDPAGEPFETLVAQLKAAVLEHADSEEAEEFPAFQARHPAYQRQAMGVALKVAEAVAPTHPHPGVESARANLMVGPYAAMLDRSRDVLRQAMRRFAADP
jgi:hemerythrin superfamily protein